MSAVGVLDLFRVGIGPSSSHTVGPMRAAGRFAAVLAGTRVEGLAAIRVELFGSLGATGVGHGTVAAVVVGLTGAEPELVDPDDVSRTMERLADSRRLTLAGGHDVAFDPTHDIELRPDVLLPGHPNGMRFTALDEAGAPVASAEYYSVGGGFVTTAEELAGPIELDAVSLPHPYRSAAELISRCSSTGNTIARLAMDNERARRPDVDVRAGVLAVWEAMRGCVDRGCRADGELPGGLGVKRRAAALHRTLTDRIGSPDPLAALDWVNLWALAVNEENAAGGRVVTAPTNGAAGIIPSVLHYYWHFVPGADEDGIVDFLVTAGAIGALFKMNASISGAEVGCQGEVGSACAMAAAGLTQVMGGSPAQIENAAEIALEHHLGLTCDPIGGLVQVPCIERNAMAATKAINATRLALHGDGTHLVSLDEAIDTLRETGRDMLDSYKETARGGLAVTFRRRAGTEPAPVPVTVVEC
ncbi:MAG: L-serine ammonia-lyase [Actinomycetota bacterium]